MGFFQVWFQKGGNLCFSGLKIEPSQHRINYWLTLLLHFKVGNGLKLFLKEQFWAIAFNEILYACHYNPRFVFFLPHFSLRPIFESGLYCRAANISLFFFLPRKSRKFEIHSCHIANKKWNVQNTNNSQLMSLVD